MSENAIVGTGLAILTLLLIAAILWDMWLRDSFTLDDKEEDEIN